MNEAQKILIKMGVDSMLVKLDKDRKRNPHYTKSGPGRKHKQKNYNSQKPSFSR